jgi:hypothetical protein
MIGLLHVKRVKNHAPIRIERGKLENLAAGYIAKRYVVIEKDGARIFGRDDSLLKAGFREHQHLRIRVNVKLLKKTGQVTETRAIFESGFASSEPLIETRHGVVRFSRVLSCGGGGREVQQCTRGQAAQDKFEQMMPQRQTPLWNARRAGFRPREALASLRGGTKVPRGLKSALHAQR